MSNDINLITHKDDQSLIELKKLKIVRNISFVFAGVIVLFSIVIFIANNAFSTSGIKSKEESAINQIAMLKDKSAKLFVVDNRIASISKIIKERNNYSSISSLISLVPSDVKINNISFDKKGISFNLISSSLLPLDGLINKFIDKTTKKEIIKNLTINSLTINQKTGSYYLSMNADFL